MRTTVERERQPEGLASTVAPAPAPSAAEAVEHLERTLSHFESMISALEERAQRQAPQDGGAREQLAGLNATLQSMFQQIEDALNRLGGEAQRLSDSASDVALVAGRLEERMGEIARSLGRGEPGPEVVFEPISTEPIFPPGDQPLQIVLANVPGFQGLMEVQRALASLPEAKGAAVVGYKNDEASLEVVLHAPVTAREIVERMSDSLGAPLLIEEARPEALRLRLRFVDGRGPAAI